MPCSLLIVNQSDYLNLIVDINSHTKWQTVQIRISCQLIWIYIAFFRSGTAWPRLYNEDIWWEIWILVSSKFYLSEESQTDFSFQFCCWPCVHLLTGWCANVWVKIHRKCHNSEAQSSQDTKEGKMRNKYSLLSLYRLRLSRITAYLEENLDPVLNLTTGILGSNFSSFPQYFQYICPTSGVSIYSRTSMARTSLGPWKFVRGTGSSSHWGLIMAPVQEANSDNLGKSFWFSTQWLYVEFTH